LTCAQGPVDPAANHAAFGSMTVAPAMNRDAAPERRKGADMVDISVEYARLADGRGGARGAAVRLRPRLPTAHGGHRDHRIIEYTERVSACVEAKPSSPSEVSSTAVMIR
jgi:hypothetical protein